MSQDNVEIVRRAIEAYNKRDAPTLVALYTDDCVLRMIGGLGGMMGPNETGEFRGHEAALGLMKDLADTFAALVDIETLREVGDQVLLIATLRTSGAASRVETTQQVGEVYSLRDGQIYAQDNSTWRTKPSKP